MIIRRIRIRIMMKMKIMTLYQTKLGENEIKMLFTFVTTSLHVSWDEDGETRRSRDRGKKASIVLETSRVLMKPLPTPHVSSPRPYTAHSAVDEKCSSVRNLYPQEDPFQSARPLGRVDSWY